MRKRPLLLRLVLLLVFVSVTLIWNYWRTQELIGKWVYDLRYEEAYINSKAEIDQVLNKLQRVPYEKLPEAYKAQTASDKSPFKAMLSNKTYYVVNGDHVYKKLIGEHRIKDFLPKDSFYKRHIKNLDPLNEIYLLLDPELLYKFLELKHSLKNKGYDPEAYQLRSVYRHPLHNANVGGASRSRHILGEALDIGVRDINQDGRSNQQDKEIVLDLLDKEIIANQGGLGLYPNTMSVHFDVRGRRARWNTY
ncbi:MAG: D-Ala-D-Ala carboxypeptidase family metallohydrolase [Bacteroidia bacterium]|nr:D-Ala-D-Ala carboxypeptidase family metallohydrolase [Bacteroidia bacterium]